MLDRRPGEHHRAPVVGLAQHYRVVVLVPVVARVDHDLGQAVVEGEIQMQNQPHRRGTDHYLDLVADLQPVRPDEVLPPNEHLQLVEERSPQILRQVGVKRDAALQDPDPFTRKLPLQQPSPLPLAYQSEHVSKI
jgi:hypothetical protein